jgi:hypothetical protein
MESNGFLSGLLSGPPSGRISGTSRDSAEPDSVDALCFLRRMRNIVTKAPETAANVAIPKANPTTAPDDSVDAPVPIFPELGSSVGFEFGGESPVAGLVQIGISSFAS